MRTTIDLPDDLLRRAKATAALQGMKLKELLARFVEQGLSQESGEPKRYGHIQPFPVMIPKTGVPIPNRTNDEILDELDRADEESRGRFT
jgi:hypothetical protein